MNPVPTEESPQGRDSEYDPAVAHSIWELERAIRRGRASEATRRTLVRAHLEQLCMTEARLGLDEPEQSFLLLQERVSPALLILPGEGEGCGSVRDLGRKLHAAGFAVLATSLAYRSREEEGPRFWQTCLDEAENRFDILNHYASRISVLGVGLGASMALHLASRKRVRSVVALFPVLDAHLGLGQALRRTWRSFLPRRFRKTPTWPVQRRLATEGVPRALNQSATPLLVISQETRSRDDAGRTLRFVQHLADRGAAKLHAVPEGAASPESLAPQDLAILLEFLQQRS